MLIIFFILTNLNFMNIYLNYIYFVKNTKRELLKRNYQNLVFFIRCFSFIAKTIFWY